MKSKLTEHKKVDIAGGRGKQRKKKTKRVVRQQAVKPVVDK